MQRLQLVGFEPPSKLQPLIRLQGLKSAVLVRALTAPFRGWLEVRFADSQARVPKANANPGFSYLGLAKAIANALAIKLH